MPEPRGRPEPQPRVAPVTQRVPARTHGALVVALVSAVVVGLLIVKPWDARPVTPPEVAILPPIQTPSAISPTQPVQPSPSLPATEPTQRPAATPRPVPVLLPEPVPFTVEPAGDGVFATCTYGRGNEGGAGQLVSMELQPPVAFAANDAGSGRIRTVAWWFELVVNRAESIFDAEWQTVTKSASQIALATDGQPAGFSALAVEFDPSVFDAAQFGPTAVYRARLVVNWYSASFDSATQTVITATRYLQVSRRTIGSAVPYCAPTRTRAATARV